MRFAKEIEADSKVRDAGLVQELLKKSKDFRTEITQQRFEQCQDWFLKKHKCVWQDFVKPEDKEAGYGLSM